MLTVSDLEKEDEGEYTCTLRWVEDNGAESSESESISISVSGEFMNTYSEQVANTIIVFFQSIKEMVV